MRMIPRRPLLAIEEALEHASTEAHPLFANYQIHRHDLEPIYSFWAEGFPGGNDHGWGHIERVIANLDQLVGHALDALSPEEIYLALTAVLYHDWALLRQRRDHPQLGATILLAASRYDLLTDVERQIVAAIVASHGSRCDISAQCRGLPKHLRVAKHTVRPCFLAALVRLADELDEDYRRAPERASAVKVLPEAATFYWHFCQHISGIGVNQQSRAIEVYASLNPSQLMDRYLVDGAAVSFLNAFAAKTFKLELERRAVSPWLPEAISPQSVVLSVSWGDPAGARPATVVLDGASKMEDVAAVLLPFLEERLKREIVESLRLASRGKYTAAVSTLARAEESIRELPPRLGMRVSYDLACYHSRLGQKTPSEEASARHLDKCRTNLRLWLELGQSTGWGEAGELPENEIYRMSRDTDLEWFVYDHRAELLCLLPEVFHKLLPARQTRPPRGGGGCIVRGTVLASPADGTPVEAVREGALLTAAHHASKCGVGWYSARVSRIRTSRGPLAIRLNDRLCCSPAQPVLRGDLAWVRADALRVGETVVSVTGPMVLEQVDYLAGESDFYDLTLTEPYHAYLANGIWCHNKYR